MKSNEGEAIQTDFKNFKESFDNFQSDIFIGQVRYKDYAKDKFYDKDNPSYDGDNSFLPFIHKRIIYEHEKEYRAILPKNLENNDKIDLNKNSNVVFIQ